MSTINYNHLKLLAIFVTTVESGSFAGAARKLNTSRSRVSEQISALELDLGIRLLQRSTRKLTLTDEGAQIFAQASQLPKLLNSIEAIATPAEPAGRVSLTLNYDIGEKFVLPVLAEFQATYPHIQLDLVFNDSKLDLISENIDLAIRIGIPKDNALVARVMHEEKFALFASPTLLKDKGIPANINALEALPWIVCSPLINNGLHHLFRRTVPVEVKPTSFTQVNSPLMAQKMAVNHQGVGLLLPSTIKAELEENKLVPVMPELSGESVVFSLIYPSRKQLPKRTRAVIDFLLAKTFFKS